MNVITATSQTQGDQPGDFCWTAHSELVRPTDACTRDQLDPDSGGCGCARAWLGLSTSRSTTTAVVRDLDLTRADVVLALAAHLYRGGWTDHGCEARCAEQADELLDIAAAFPVGTVLGRRLDDVIRSTTPVTRGDRRARGRPAPGAGAHLTSERPTLYVLPAAKPGRQSRLAAPTRGQTVRAIPL